MIPKDPVMLLSYVNTQLRDYYDSLDDFLKDKELVRREPDKETRVDRL